MPESWFMVEGPHRVGAFEEETDVVRAWIEGILALPLPSTISAEEREDAKTLMRILCAYLETPAQMIASTIMIGRMARARRGATP